VREAVERAAPEGSDDEDLVAAIDRLVPLNRYESEALAVVADARWYAAPVGDDSRAPLAELHRWPGDTVLALYALDPDYDEKRDPPVPGRCADPEPVMKTGQLEWAGEFETELGERPWLWIVRNAGDGIPRLGALLLPSDAGLGAEAVSVLTEESRTVLARVEIRKEVWKDVPYLEPGQIVLPPSFYATPGDAAEGEQPWQVASGSGFTIGLPPGIRAMRLDAGVHAPVNLPGGLMWLRGRYRDVDGNRVVVGDGLRVGYVARVEESAKPWVSGKQAPLGAPGATKAASHGYSHASEWSGARSTKAERWTEPGFDGDWLVFRLAFKDEGIEIGLPVVEGWRSESLFWIAPSWRRAGLPPAPPPVDSTNRFGIRFSRLVGQERKYASSIEGSLEVPGLRLNLPRGFQPELSPQSSDGYPIHFVGGDGGLLGTLHRIEEVELEAFVDSLPDLAESRRGADRHDAERVLQSVDGKRVFVSEQGQAYYFEPSPVTAGSSVESRGTPHPARELWDELTNSVRLDVS
jgi:hypothetical protein